MTKNYFTYLLVFLSIVCFGNLSIAQCSQSIVFPSAQSNAVTHINGSSYSLGNGVLSLTHTRFGSAGSNSVNISSSHQPEFGIRTEIGSSSASFTNRTENQLSFSQPVYNLRFDINDVDDGDHIRIFAYDQNNTLINFTTSNFTLYASTIITYTASPNKEFSTSAGTSSSTETRSRISVNFNGSYVSRVIVAYYDTDTDGSTTIANLQSSSLCANPDNYSGTSGTASTTTSVLANDFHLAVAASTSNVTVSAVGALPTGFTLNSNGTISVANTVAQGVYVINYRICSITTPGNCATSTATITMAPNPCGTVDSDGDGVFDGCDWDDDNDGILDAVESPNCFYSSAEAHAIIKVTSPYNAASGDLFTTLHDLNSSNSNPFNFASSQTITSGSAVFNFEMPTRVLLTSLAITQSTNGMLSTTNRFGVLYGSNDGITYTAISATAGVQLHSTTVSFSVTSSTPYRYYQIRYIGTVSGGNTTSGTLGTAAIQEIVPTYNTTNYQPSANQKPGPCISDGDSDGIPNHLDTDSDGDGCADVIEGGATFAIGASYITANRLNTTVNSNGVPGVPASTTGYDQTNGQTIDRSQNQLLNECARVDSDGDGIFDDVDLDDDNDGILDTEEGFCTSQSVYSMNIPSTRASAESSFNAAGSTFNLVYTLTSGTAVAGLGTSFNVPFIYSDFNNLTSSVNHQWEKIVSNGTTVVGIAPVVNPFFSSLPTNNTQTENIDAATPVGSQDGRFRYLLNNGLIDRLGTYTTQIGNLPSVSGSLSSYLSSTPIGQYSVYNVLASTTGPNDYFNGYYSRLQITTSVLSLSAPQTINTTSRYGQTFLWDYTAFNNGISTLVTNNNGGLISIFANNITYCNHRDTDGDGTPDYLDLDSDGDGCPDALEGAGNFTASQLTNASGAIAAQTPNQNFGITVDANGIPTIVNGGQSLGDSQNGTISPCCSNPPNLSPATDFTKTGISNLAGFANGWPGNVPNGFIAIESRNKGFVITRVANTSVITNPVPGMLIYDLSNSPTPCVKLYNGSIWKCLEKDCSGPTN